MQPTCSNRYFAIVRTFILNEPKPCYATLSQYSLNPVTVIAVNSRIYINHFRLFRFGYLNFIRLCIILFRFLLLTGSSFNFFDSLMGVFTSTVFSFFAVIISN